MAFSISDIVRVTAKVAPPGAAEGEFGKALFFKSYIVPSVGDTGFTVAAQKEGLAVRTFQNSDGVISEYGENTPAADAALAWFSQSPIPHDFLVGNYCPNGLASVVVSAPITATLAEIKALTGANSTQFNVNGETTTTAANLANPSTMSAVATALTTSIKTLSSISGAVVSWDATTKTLTFAFPQSDAVDLDAGPFGPVDAAMKTALGLDSPSEYINGFASETIGVALSRIRRTNADWYYLLHEHDLADNKTVIEAAATWAEASSDPVFFFVDTHEAAVLVTGESGSTGQSILATKPVDTTVIYSAQPYLAPRVAAKMSAINFDRAQSIVNPMWATYEGASPDSQLTYGQRQELERKRVNYYIGSDGRETLREGWTGASWIDTKVWIDWFVDALQVAGFNFLKRAPSRVPLTREGMAGLKAEFERVCERGLVNGGIAAGTLSAPLATNLRQATGLSEFDGDLSTGYLVWHPPVAEIAQAKRDAREAPPFTIWIKGSGAVNKLDLQVIFEE